MAESRREHGGTAGARLVVIPELMEMILPELPLKDVVAAQRVNKDFRDDLDPTARSYLTALFPVSLERMQIFQPPAFEVWLHCPAVFVAKDEDGKCYEHHWHSIRAREGQPGVPVGDLKEHADRFGGMVELVIPFGTKLLDQRDDPSRTSWFRPQNAAYREQFEGGL